MHLFMTRLKSPRKMVSKYVSSLSLLLMILGKVAINLTCSYSLLEAYIWVKQPVPNYNRIKQMASSVSIIWQRRHGFVVSDTKPISTIYCFEEYHFRAWQFLIQLSGGASTLMWLWFKTSHCICAWLCLCLSEIKRHLIINPTCLFI